MTKTDKQKKKKYNMSVSCLSSVSLRIRHYMSDRLDVNKTITSLRAVYSFMIGKRNKTVKLEAIDIVWHTYPRKQTV